MHSRQFRVHNGGLSRQGTVIARMAKTHANRAQDRKASAGEAALPDPFPLPTGTLDRFSIAQGARTTLSESGLTLCRTDAATRRGTTLLAMGEEDRAQLGWITRAIADYLVARNIPDLESTLFSSVVFCAHGILLVGRELQSTGRVHVSEAGINEILKHANAGFPTGCSFHIGLFGQNLKLFAACRIARPDGKKNVPGVSSTDKLRALLALTPK